MRSILLILLMSFPFSNAANEHLAEAERYQEGVALRDYFVSEKYDGVRAYWDGSQLTSRSGRLIPAPDEFLHQLPSFAVEGELWFGRGQFARANALIKRTADTAQYLSEWRAVRYMLFDAPKLAGDFTERLLALQGLSGRQVQAAPQWSVQSHDELMQLLQSLTAAGAEGLMLRRKVGAYRAGRSDDLLKVKLWQDAEATVLRHLPGQGKYQGMLGALLVELDDGRQLRIGTGFTDQQRAQPPAIGSRITYKHQGYTSTGLPRFAVYWRARPTE